MGVLKQCVVLFWSMILPFEASKYGKKLSIYGIFLEVGDETYN